MRPLGAVLVPLSSLVWLQACVPIAAIHQAEREQAIQRGHTRDESLPEEARAVARDGLDAWSVQLELLDGRPLPPDVAERMTQPRGEGEQ